MSMISYNPQRPVWERNMMVPLDKNRVPDLLQPAMKRARETVQEYSPLLSADIIEGSNNFHVFVDLPGVDPDDLDINISNGYLNLNAQRRQLHEDDDGFTHKIERSYGKVQRSISIPFGANTDSATAKFHNGVLSVRFDKNPELLPGRKLQIK